MRSWIPVALPGPFHSCPYAPDSIRNQYASLSNLKHAAWANPSNPAPEFGRARFPWEFVLGKPATDTKSGRESCRLIQFRISALLPKVSNKEQF